ncbi:MAG: SPOR domain-containing protein [Bacteroidetes bacterium]|jgi:cell division septation protein DedD|nr:SPOR domain-containing protein [Bacteroidota bacterium]
MPDLNLIDDEPSGEESFASEAPERPAAKGGGGGGTLRLVIILSLLVLIIAGLLYVLNSRGIVHLWGKKQQTVVQVPDEQYPPDQFNDETFAQQPMDTMAAGEAAEEMALLETTPIEEGAPAEPAPASPEPLAGSGALKDMKGDYTIQVVAFREKEKAVDILQNLEIAGYPAFVEKVPMKGGDWYTVRIGRYPTRGDAKLAVASFAEQIRSNYVIDRVRSK